MKDWLFKLTLGSMLVISAVAGASEQSPPPKTTEVESTPLLSEQEFKRQKELMISDTAAKITILQAANSCAKAATTPKDFSICNQELREAIFGKK